MLAYNSAVHKSTGFAPSELMRGWNPRLPVDLILGRPEEAEPVTHSEYAERLVDHLEKCHELAREHQSQATEKSRVYYDSVAMNKTYAAGDVVWLYNFQRKKGLSPKLQRFWEGPYVVTEKVSDVTYRIQMAPRTKSKVRHFNLLTPYMGDEPPTWFPGTQGGPSEVEQVTVNQVDTSPVVPERSHAEEEIPELSEDSSDEEEDVCTETQDAPSRRSTRRRQAPQRLDL